MRDGDGWTECTLGHRHWGRYGAAGLLAVTQGAPFVLMQHRADGSFRDVFHLTPGRRVLLGREEGDWVFPYDQTMSGCHAEVRSEDSEFVLADAGSRNGVAVAVRGDRELRKGQRVLVGDQVMRVESV